MQAQRKLADPALTTSPARTTPVESADFALPQLDDGALPSSPAIMLQAQLAARLAVPAAGSAVTQDAIDEPGYKLPMALRIATIVALSLALWGGIVFTAVKALA